MAKQVLKIDKFEGGLNDKSDPRDIADNELSEATDIMVDQFGKIRTMGGTASSIDPKAATISPGYGLQQISMDRLDAENPNIIGDSLLEVDSITDLSDTNTNTAGTYTNVTLWEDDGHSTDSGAKCTVVLKEKIEDFDGNFYGEIAIGSYVWLDRNFKCTTYADGTPIDTGHTNSAWADLDETETGAYAVYNDDLSNQTTYGNLYNWYAVDGEDSTYDFGIYNASDQLIWRVPTDAEWQDLEEALGMSEDEAANTGWRGTDEGGKLKETGLEHWNSPNEGATNSSGFTALPGGNRGYSTGNYLNMGDNGLFWSSSEFGSDYAWYRLLSYSNSDVNRNIIKKESGCSVRLVRV